MDPFSRIEGSARDAATITTDLWAGLTDVLWMVGLAIVILLIGLFVSSMLSGLVRKIVRAAKIDKAFENMGLKEKFEEYGWTVTPSGIIAWIVKWFFIIVTFMLLANMLGWGQVTEFFKEVVLYLPNLIIAVLVLVIGLIASQFVHTAVSKSLTNATLSEGAKKIVPLVPKYAIIVFAVSEALIRIGVGRELILTLFTAVVGALALGLGLAFGLGGKDRAKEIVDRIGR